MPVWGHFYFQNSSCFIMECLIYLHDYIMMIMVVVLIMVGYFLFFFMKNKGYDLMIFSGQGLEVVWTIIPIFFLLFIAFPSLNLLYIMDDYETDSISVKVLGHQWYWSYEYSWLNMISYDSYMLDEEFEFRLVETDNLVVLPFNVSVQMLVGSMDVIHSWSIPSMGMKVDAVPGRLNQLMFFVDRVGLFVGQCSEICGANHSFMPIMVLTLPVMKFLELLDDFFSGWWSY